jgi:hypothetical protein
MIPAMVAIPVSAAQMREFVARDWGRVEEANREHWRARMRAEGPDVLLAATSAMWQRLRAIDPHWPSAQSRAGDLEHLVRFKQRLDAASLAFTRRPRAR